MVLSCTLIVPGLRINKPLRFVDFRIFKIYFDLLNLWRSMLNGERRISELNGFTGAGMNAGNRVDK